MSKLTKRLTVGAASLALAVGGLGVGSVDANAIVRAPCNGANVEVFSTHSTCWAHAGGVNVYLADTAGVKGGINSGFVRNIYKKQKSTVDFKAKAKPITWPGRVTYYVAILNKP